jgi:hypothetical protein
LAFPEGAMTDNIQLIDDPPNGHIDTPNVRTETDMMCTDRRQDDRASLLPLHAIHRSHRDLREIIPKGVSDLFDLGRIKGQDKRRRGGCILLAREEDDLLYGIEFSPIDPRVCMLFFLALNIVPYGGS